MTVREYRRVLPAEVASYEAAGWRIAGATTFNEGLGVEVLMVREILNQEDL